jgi:hypothetical protein
MVTPEHLHHYALNCIYNGMTPLHFITWKGYTINILWIKHDYIGDK